MEGRWVARYLLSTRYAATVFVDKWLTVVGNSSTTTSARFSQNLTIVVLGEEGGGGLHSRGKQSEHTPF